jgi:hypothetical protein
MNAPGGEWDFGLADDATENHAAGDFLYLTSILKENSRQPKTNLEADDRPVNSSRLDRISAVPNVDRENPGVVSSAISAAPRPVESRGGYLRVKPDIFRTITYLSD